MPDMGHAPPRELAAKPRNLVHDRGARAPLRPEGEGGFSQCWYPICLSEEVAAGDVAGFDFLDGRVVAFRDASGTVQVLSAYCPHMGADLSAGVLVGDQVRCAYHHWKFDASGVCREVRVGDPIPAKAKLFRFPTAERYGLVWAFNGETPLFDLPTFKSPSGNLIWRAERHSTYPCDPAVGVSNAFDLQHFLAVHEMQVDLETYYANLRWEKLGVTARLDTVMPDTGATASWHTKVFGTNLLSITGQYGPSWFGQFTAGTIRSPGLTELYLVTLVDGGDGGTEAQAAAQALVSGIHAFHVTETHKDIILLNSIRLVTGTLTATDRAMAEWFKFVRDYPRAHPSADYIR